MTESTQIREIILEVLLQINRDGEHSHLAIRHALDKVQYLPRQERAFINRVCQGTIEHRIRIDYVIDRYSSVKTQKMKPVIRDILRSAVYQLLFMDGVPDSAACNEAVKLAQKKGFFNLKGFVNGVLRSVARNMDKVEYPDAETMPVAHLSILYSMPEWIVKKWLSSYSYETVEQILQAFQEKQPTSVRMNLNKATKKQIEDSLREQGVSVEEHPYLPYALEISGYNYLKALDAFRNGWIQAQDVSSMLVAEIADPKWGDYCIDVCAAPGGKSLHLADKLKGSGFVEARDVTESKVQLMQENIERTGLINMNAIVADATIFYPSSVEKADVLIADVPCSGFGVMGRKPDIRYKTSEGKQEEIVRLQRKILETVYQYVKVGGTLVYSTCTIGAEENQYNLKWFLDNYPFKLESIDEYLPDELKSRTTKAGYLQILPGIHKADGFFIAKLKRIG